MIYTAQQALRNKISYTALVISLVLFYFAFQDQENAILTIAAVTTFLFYAGLRRYPWHLIMGQTMFGITSKALYKIVIVLVSVLLIAKIVFLQIGGFTENSIAVMGSVALLVGVYINYRLQ